MNELIQLVIRHGLASLGGFFAAYNITGNTTASIVTGLVTLAIPAVWSWVAKLLHLEKIKTEDITGSEVLRTLLGSLISQGITALSVYFAVDADNPEALLIALANAGVSKIGLHQKMMGLPGAARVLLLSGMLSLSSCTGLTAFMASSAGQATVSLIDLGLNVAAAKGKIAPGDNVAIQRGLAIVTNPTDPATVKVFTLAELGLSVAVSKGLIKQGDALIIQEAGVIIQSAVLPVQPTAKQPVNVTLSQTINRRGLCFGNPAGCQSAPNAPHKRAGHPALQRNGGAAPLSFPPDDVPGCMQIADRIPLYGERVAFMLSTAAVK